MFAGISKAGISPKGHFNPFIRRRPERDFTGIAHANKGNFIIRPLDVGDLLVGERLLCTDQQVGDGIAMVFGRNRRTPRKGNPGFRQGKVYMDDIFFGFGSDQVKI
jgi:hypothetical protein